MREDFYPQITQITQMKTECSNGMSIFPSCIRYLMSFYSFCVSLVPCFLFLFICVSAFLVTGGRCMAQAAPQRLTLEQSVREALLHSSQIKAAQASRDVSRVQADREKPTARPTVTATASGTAQGPRVTFPRPDGTAATVLPEGVGRVDLVVEQPLYHAGFRAAKQRYESQLSAGELEFRKALADVVLTVRKAYLNVLRAESGVRTAQDGVAAAIRYQELVTRQITAGQAKPVDSETVKAQVAEAQTGLSQAEGGVSLAKMNFNRVLGRNLTAPILLEEIAAPPVVPDNPDAAVEKALQNRPELGLLQQNLRGANAGVSLARTQTQPTVSARGQITEQTPSAFLHEHYYAATLELRWPLLDGGKARQDTQEAKAQVNRLQALLDDARQGIALDVSQSWQKMRDAQSKISLTAVQRQGLEATEQVAEKAYEVGRSTALEVQAAQREVRNVRERELQALYDLQTAYADFLYAQGELLTGSDLSEKKP